MRPSTYYFAGHRFRPCLLYTHYISIILSIIYPFSFRLFCPAIISMRARYTKRNIYTGTGGKTRKGGGLAYLQATIRLKYRAREPGFCLDFIFVFLVSEFLTVSGPGAPPRSHVRPLL